jgi:hypothetical protein
MRDELAGDGAKYQRELLLGPKRSQVLDLWEVERYGVDTFGDRDHVSVFGMRPVEWYARGIRLFGRTVVECTRDELADAIGTDIASLCPHGLPAAHVRVIDPFAGSANTLYWMLHRLPGAVGFGVELDPSVCALTKKNLAQLTLPIDVVNADYQSALLDVAVPDDLPVVAFVAPPWGNALSKETGLDLRYTTPPILEVVHFLLGHFGRNPLLCAIQMLEATDPASLEEVKDAFDWTAVRLYDLSPTYGRRPGILLGTRHWISPTHRP